MSSNNSDISEQNLEERLKLYKNISDGKFKLISSNIRIQEGKKIFDGPCAINRLFKILELPIKKIGSGNYGNIYQYCLENKCKFSFVIKSTKIDSLVYDYKQGYDNPYLPENVEIQMTKTLNKLLYDYNSPNIPLYIGDFKCFISKYPNSFYKRYLITEKADGSLSSILRIFIKKFYKNQDIKSTLLNIKSIFFQIVAMLYIIQYKYPKFKHNDLHIGNILYKKISSPTFYTYNYDDKLFTVPVEYKLIIWDFDFSSIAGYIDNIKTFEFHGGLSLNFDNPLGIFEEPNKYLDLHKIFNSIRSIFYKVDIPIQKYNFFNFLDIIVPQKFRGSTVPGFVYNYSLYYDYEFITPKDVLHFPYFNEFLNQDSDEENINNFFSDENMFINYVPYNPPVQNKTKFLEYKLDYIKYKNPKMNDKSQNHEQTISSYVSPDKYDSYHSKAEKYLIQILNDILKSSSENEHLKLHSFNLYSNHEMVLQTSLELIFLFYHYMYMDIDISLNKILWFITLDKAIYYIIHVHFYDASWIDEQIIGNYYTKILEFMVQFQKFLEKYSIEDFFLNKFKLHPYNN